jgi:hypothetical protein
MTQLFWSERAKPNRLPDQGRDACVPRYSEAPQERANVQLLMDLEPLEDGWHGTQAHPPLAASRPRTGDRFGAIQRP